jgi:transmembrane sensor
LTVAIEWRLRLRQGGADDWAQFTQWLEQDSAHAEAYDQVALLDGDLDALAAADQADRAAARADWTDGTSSSFLRRPLRRLGAIFAIVAAFALLAFLWQPTSRSSRSGFEIATASGEHRTVALGDGSSVVLNGNSRVWIASAEGREAELLRGEAVFNIRHDPKQPFALHLGEDRIEDVGTVFNVVRDQQVLRVEVADGAVRYVRGRNGLQLNAGQTLKISPSGDAIVGRKSPGAIASWQSGQLVFEAVPVAEVAADLGRNLGVKISVGPRLAYQPFTGSIHVGRRTQQVVPEFASTLSAHARKSGDGWLIE